MATTKLSRALVGFAWLSDRVVRVSASGELCDDSGPALAAALDGTLSEVTRPVTMCWDLSRLQRWDPSSRRDILRTLLEHRPQVWEHHVHVTGQLAMDMRVVALMLGNMTCYQARSLYEYAVEVAMGAAYRECA
jgi:hypothetical protein